MGGLSIKQQIRAIVATEGEAAAASILAALSPAEAEEALRGAWWFTARPEQLLPGDDWRWYLVQCGRGWG